MSPRIRARGRVFGALCALLTSPAALPDDAARRAGGHAASGLPAGVSAEATIYADLVAAWRSGTRIGSGAAWLADLSAELDTGGAGLWEGGLFRASLAGTTGAEPTTFLGDIQGTSNIEAPEALWVHDLYYEHESASGAWSFLAGMHDLNSDFAAPDASGATIHSSLSYAPDVSQTGVSTYPSTAPGARLRYSAASGVSATLGVYDGVAGDPRDPVGTTIILRGEEGAFWIGEAAARRRVAADDAVRLAAGAWHLDRALETHAGGPENGASGAYGVAEWTRELRGGGSLAAYVQAGRADDAVFEIDGYVGGAVVWDADRGRLENVIAGVARVSSSPRWRSTVPGAGRHETAWEVSASFAAGRGITLQPHVQVIVHAGFDRETADALLVGVRVVTGPWAAPSRGAPPGDQSLQ